MSEYGYVKMPPSTAEYSRKAAVIGVGESDFFADYRAERTRPEGWEPPTLEGLLKLAFNRAVADAGIDRADIDTLALSLTYGGVEPDDAAKLLGMNPKRAYLNGHIMAGPLPAACGEIADGRSDIIAMVFGISSRSMGRNYGGTTFLSGMGGPSSYYYYHPWGWSSQAAHWAMMFSYYAGQYGKGEDDLAHVAMQLRDHATKNPNAVMQKPMSLGDYKASRYIVRPLHLFDICLVNDGAVCVLLSKSELAKQFAKPPVEVAGWAESYITHSKMDQMVRQRLRPQLQESGAAALAMAGLSLDDIGHFEGYDPSSFQLINQIEGYGFTAPGTGLDFCGDGQMTAGGRIPSNTSGGNLSGSYMQGWSQIVEAVRQLRHEANVQAPGVTASMTSLAQTDAAHPIIFTRGE